MSIKLINYINLAIWSHLVDMSMHIYMDNRCTLGFTEGKAHVFQNKSAPNIFLLQKHLCCDRLTTFLWLWLKLLPSQILIAISIKYNYFVIYYQYLLLKNLQCVWKPVTFTEPQCSVIEWRHWPSSTSQTFLKPPHKQWKLRKEMEVH